jgi:hypothetical protein
MNRYSLIYADPAWSYGNTISNGAAADHYPTMSLLDMKRLPVWELAADNAVLAMWYTGTHNQEAIELAEAWGFTVRTMKGFTWVKLNQLAELRITKALAEGDIADFYACNLLHCPGIVIESPAHGKSSVKIFLSYCRYLISCAPRCCQVLHITAVNYDAIAVVVPLQD